MTTTAAPAGLTQLDAERRLAARPAVPQQTSRSYSSIVVANVFTVFNLILLVFGVVTLAFGEAQDALFLAILVANSVIGIAQEVRAKWTLDRLAALVAPTATVLRDGKPRRVRVAAVVEGDVVLLEPGDLVFFDGEGHVGIYIGHGRFIHAPHTGTVVSISTMSGWYGARFDGARRLS